MAVVCVALLVVAQPFRAALAQQNANALANFIKVQAPVVALTHVRVIDGTGAAARENQTLVIRDGNIAELGDAARVTPPAGATVIDLTGKSVIPGLVMMHEHLYYTTGPGVYGQLGVSFSRLYLAGGVTTMRTAGNVNGIMDINLSRRIAAGEMPGPAIDATAPYVNGPSPFLQMHALNTADEARKHVAYWAEQGSTSLKAYMQISRAALKAAIDEGHRRGLKITGHLCSVTYAEAADLGIDNLEHGFFAATDFVADKQPDVCPGSGARAADDRGARRERRAVQGAGQKARGQARRADLDADRLRDLHARPAAAAGAGRADAAAQGQFPAGQRARRAEPAVDVRRALSQRDAARARVREGGRRPPGRHRSDRAGGVVPGYADQRQIELLVEEGFTPVQAISIGTLNGAKYLGRDARIGSIASGKQADLVVIDGDPSRTIADIRKVDTVFKNGVGFDPDKLIASVRGQVGIW